MMADTTVSETLEGKLVPEALDGEIAAPETLELEGEPVVPEPFEGVPAVPETEDEPDDCENEIDSTESESEEFFAVAGLLAPMDETEEYVLEGDVIYSPEEEEQP